MKRKDFFKWTTAGVTGLVLGTSCKRVDRDTATEISAAGPKTEPPAYRKAIKSSFSADNRKSPGDKVVLALIGAGSRGTSLALSTAEHEDNVEFKYVCDVDDTRGGRAITELERIQGFKPGKVKDMRQVFDDKDVDGVLITTPEHWHALGTIWACQAGKDVYVEKNISINIFENQQMVKAAMKYERVVQSGTQNRSADYAITARDYIRSGKLGEIGAVNIRSLMQGPLEFNESENTNPPETLDWNLWLGPAPKVPYNVTRHKSWTWYWDYSGGYITGDEAVHQLDLLRLVLDDPGFPKSIYSAGGRYFYEDSRDMPDIHMTTFDYGNWLLTLQTGQFTPYMRKTPPKVRYGDTFPDWMQNSTRIEILGTQQMMFLGRHGGGWQAFDKDDQLVAQDSGIHSTIAHLSDFVDCIRTRKQPKGNIVEGHKSASLIHLANFAHRAGNKQLLFSPEYETILNNEKASALARGAYRNGFEVPRNV